MRNLGYYDLNSARSFPLDDGAKLIDDSGQWLPHDLLVDLYLLFPNTLGDRAFLSAITVGPRLVTVAFLVDSPSFTPLATISILQPVQIGRQYQLESQVAGAGGWIVFGSGIKNNSRRSFRFSSAEQSFITLQASRKYRPTPVKSLGKLFTEPGLTGIVKLTGGDDVEIVKEEREIGGVLRDVAVVRLKDKTDSGGRNLYDIYRGRCNRRPESRNCGDPPPIEFLSSVGPDCCGRIYVELRGCATISATQTDGCGILIDCGIGIADACVSVDRLPDADGTLPNTYSDECISLSEDVD